MIWRNTSRSSTACLVPTYGSNSVLLNSMLEQGVRSPWTTSAGRVFDGIASLLGLRQVSEFEGDAAMTLEFVADMSERGAYDLPLCSLSDESLVLDWSVLVRELISDRVKAPASKRRRRACTTPW